MNNSATIEKIHIWINTEAYEAIEEMWFELIDDLQVFGEEVREKQQ